MILLGIFIKKKKKIVKFTKCTATVQTMSLNNESIVFFLQFNKVVNMEINNNFKINTVVRRPHVNGDVFFFKIQLEF